MTALPDTRQAIMTAARLAVQARGYNSLSFRELAKEIGIKSASIHYHFPTKGDLAAALAKRYTDDAMAYFDSLLSTSEDMGQRIRGYTDIFRAVLVNDNRMCLYGIMAAERDDLPPEVRVEVERFTDVNVEWLTRLFSAGGSSPVEPARQRALAVFAAIEGAQLVARSRGDITLFDNAIETYRALGLFP